MTTPSLELANDSTVTVKKQQTKSAESYVRRVHKGFVQLVRTISIRNVAIRLHLPRSAHNSYYHNRGIFGN